MLVKWTNYKVNFIIPFTSQAIVYVCNAVLRTPLAQALSMYAWLVKGITKNTYKILQSEYRIPPPNGDRGLFQRTFSWYVQCTSRKRKYIWNFFTTIRELLHNYCMSILNYRYVHGIDCLVLSLMRYWRHTRGWFNTGPCLNGLSHQSRQKNYRSTARAVQSIIYKSWGVCRGNGGCGVTELKKSTL